MTTISSSLGATGDDAEPVPTDATDPDDATDPTAAFAAVYEARYPHLVRLARLVGDSGRGEEIVQDAFVQLYRQWERVEQPVPWLRAAVINGCRSAGRRRTVARRHTTAPVDEPQPDDAEALAVRDALRTLTPRQRAAVVLRYFDDLPERDIAAALGCRPGTVKSLLARALPPTQRGTRMIDLDQRLHRSLSTLAEARPVTTPPISAIVDAANARAVTRPHRPRRVVVAAVAGGLTLGVGGAALAGVLPGPVSDAFHRMSGWGGPCRIDKTDARLVASTRMPNGSTFEWWSSPTAKSGQVDEFTRVVSASGRSHHVESMSCAPRADATSKVVIGGASTTRTQVDLWGQAPLGTAALSVALSDGSSTALPLQGDRYFMGAFATPGGAPHPVTVVARASDGTVLDTLNVDFPRG